jgi:hypothetical protein
LLWYAVDVVDVQGVMEDAARALLCRHLYRHHRRSSPSLPAGLSSV